MPRKYSTWPWSSCPGAIADPDHVTRGRVPVAGRRIDPRQGLFVAEQQRLVAGVEIGGAQFGMAFEIEAAGTHEIQRVRDAVCQFLVTPRLQGILNEAKHPLMHAAEIGKAAGGKRAQQIEAWLPTGDMPSTDAADGETRLRREGDVVDDVATVAWQFDAVDRLDRRGAWLGELPGNAATFTTGSAPA